MIRILQSGNYALTWRMKARMSNFGVSSFLYYGPMATGTAIFLTGVGMNRRKPKRIKFHRRIGRGWPYLDDMKALMYAHPQVYVDTGVIAWILPREEFHKFIEGLVDACRALSWPDRGGDSSR